MSAGRWSVCSKCELKHEKDILNEISTLEIEIKEYGNIPPDEFIRKHFRLKELQAMEDFDELTLREDWEIGIDGDVFHISYECSCVKCGFSWKYSHKKKVE